MFAQGQRFFMGSRWRFQQGKGGLLRLPVGLDEEGGDEDEYGRYQPYGGETPVLPHRLPETQPPGPRVHDGNGYRHQYKQGGGVKQQRPAQ